MTNLAESTALDANIKSAGINLGYGNTKVKTDGRYFQYISDVSRAKDRQARDRLGMSDQDSQFVAYDGKLYEVGDDAGLSNAPRERKTIFPFWAGTETYMVLAQSVLDRLAQEGSDWIVTVGVPINEVRDEDYTSKVKSIWIGEHQTAHGVLRIHDVKVVAEPSGALFYYGSKVVSMETLRQQSLTILDWGYLTTLGTTHRRLVPDFDNTIHLDQGASGVAEHITAAIMKKYREERDVVEVERAMLGRLTISIDGAPVDIKPLATDAIADVGGRLIESIRTKMKKPASRIYLVGGGAHLFGDMFCKAFEAVSKVDISDNPQQANALGLHQMSVVNLHHLRRAGKLPELLTNELPKHYV